MIKCTILGCGSADGVPRTACDCNVCSRCLMHNRRSRCSALLEFSNKTLLIDTPPDIRQQMLRHKIEKIDGIFYTHAHFDHIAGIDDISSLKAGHEGECIPTFMSINVAKEMFKQFGYAFSLNNTYNTRHQQPFLKPVLVKDKFQFGDSTIHVSEHKHGSILSYGLRIAKFAYIIDLEQIDIELHVQLQGVRALVIGCFSKEVSATHMNLTRVLRSVQILRPALTVLTHMSHTLDYYTLKRTLPKNVVPAYDGAVVYINETDVGIL